MDMIFSRQRKSWSSCQNILRHLKTTVPLHSYCVSVSIIKRLSTWKVKIKENRRTILMKEINAKTPGFLATTSSIFEVLNYWQSTSKILDKCFKLITCISNVVPISMLLPSTLESISKIYLKRLTPILGEWNIIFTIVLNSVINMELLIKYIDILVRLIMIWN